MEVSELNQRLSHLEHIVGTSESSAEVVNTRVVDLYNKTQQLLSKVPSFTPFFEKYKQIDKQRNALSFDTKVELLLAAQDRLQSQIGFLKQIQELNEFINPEPLKDLTTFNPDEIQKWQAEKFQLAYLIYSQIQKIQEQNNTITELISIRFLQMDAKLTEWESKLSQQ